MNLVLAVIGVSAVVAGGAVWWFRGVWSARRVARAEQSRDEARAEAVRSEASRRRAELERDRERIRVGAAERRIKIEREQRHEEEEIEDEDEAGLADRLDHVFDRRRLR